MISTVVRVIARQRVNLNRYTTREENHNTKATELLNIR